MFTQQWELNDELADIAKVPRLNKLVANLFNTAIQRRRTTRDYRKDTYVVSGDEFELILHSSY